MTPEELEALIREHNIDPMLALAYRLLEMGITRQELHHLCRKLRHIPETTLFKLENFFRDITQ